jgi:glutathione synthase/RimK-type ligase-like ATP-grasp enzyme
MKRFGMCFSRDFEGITPLSHIGKKLPVYLRLLELCKAEGWEVYALTRKTYKGDSSFDGAWLFKNGKFERIEKLIKIDLVFDWVGSLLFPPKNKEGLRVVNTRQFKELACNKWEAYQMLSDYMPKTYWVGDLKNVGKLVGQITTDNIVLKPYDGLRGKGVFIGPKEELENFKPEKPGKKYILQEFIDTSRGIPNITVGKHDLRIVVVNGQAVWCHVRIPAVGSLLANAAQGGNLTEVSYDLVPESVKKIVNIVSGNFYREYDNPIFSIDFGINEKGEPKIFEINDQIGFPRWEMKNRDVFLKALVQNFYNSIQENSVRKHRIELNADMSSSKTKGNPSRKAVGGHHEKI